MCDYVVLIYWITIHVWLCCLDWLNNNTRVTVLWLPVLCLCHLSWVLCRVCQATGGQDKMLRVWVLKEACSYFIDMRHKYMYTQGTVHTAGSRETLRDIYAKLADFLLFVLHQKITVYFCIHVAMVTNHVCLYVRMYVYSHMTQWILW